MWQKSQSISHHLGFWKAEELQKFAFPASKYVLGGVLLDEQYRIWILAVRITELVFGSGREGWTQEMLDLAKNLILRHNVLVEETQEIKFCHVTLHNMVHLVDDKERFSALGTFLCEGCS